MAGLLTYSSLKHLPVCTVVKSLRTNEITAAGTVHELHVIPFSFRISGNPSCNKCNGIILINTRGNGFKWMSLFPSFSKTLIEVFT
jgi:hypothetical protein